MDVSQINFNAKEGVYQCKKHSNASTYSPSYILSPLLDWPDKLLLHTEGARASIGRSRSKSFVGMQRSGSKGRLASDHVRVKSVAFTWARARIRYDSDAGDTCIFSTWFSVL